MKKIPLGRLGWAFFSVAILLNVSMDTVHAEASKETLASASTAQAPNVNALDVLQRASDFLKQQPHYQLKATILEDEVLPSGEKLQFQRDVSATFEKPNRLRLEGTGPRMDRVFWYQDGQFTLLNRSRNAYVQLPAPTDMDEALDTLVTKYHAQMPLIDFFYSDFASGIKPKIQNERYYGLEKLGQYTCYHLFFSQENIDWQLWVDEGTTPYIRKVVITYKNDPSQPQYEAFFRDWNTQQELPKDAFQVVLPQDAKKLGVLTTVEPSPSN